MYNFKLGDLVCKKHGDIQLKIGIVIKENKNNFLVKWTSYNKSFFLEEDKDDNEIYKELNKLYLLSTQSIDRTNKGAELVVISSS